MINPARALRWEARPFAGLGVTTLHGLLALRSAVFVVEQRCAYQDPDSIDLRAVHLVGRDDTGIAACARWYEGAADEPETVLEPGGPPLPPLHLGRIVTRQDVRGRGLGHELMHVAHDLMLGGAPRTVVMSAQDHLRGYYAQHGYAPVGPVYDEDGIPHVRMVRPAEAALE